MAYMIHKPCLIYKCIIIDNTADFGDCDIAEVMEVCAPALIKVGVYAESIEPERGRLKTELFNR
jgi:hypothetical protein